MTAAAAGPCLLYYVYCALQYNSSTLQLPAGKKYNGQYKCGPGGSRADSGSRKVAGRGAARAERGNFKRIPVQGMGTPRAQGQSRSSHPHRGSIDFQRVHGESLMSVQVS